MVPVFPYSAVIALPLGVAALATAILCFRRGRDRAGRALLTGTLLGGVICAVAGLVLTSVCGFLLYGMAWVDGVAPAWYW